VTKTAGNNFIFYNCTSMLRKSTLIAFLIALSLLPAFAEDGYELWLRYTPLENQKTVKQYRQFFRSIYCPGNSETETLAVRELQLGLGKMLSISPQVSPSITDGTILLILADNAVLPLDIKTKAGKLVNEGFVITSALINKKKCTIITGHSNLSLLYGAFELLRLLKMETEVNNLFYETSPSIKNRILNHWDNLDRTVERGYAGFSLWDWHRLPHYIDQRYHDYARANASLGINGTVLTNVNANALILTDGYLRKVKALADVFRPYGIKVYLTARFSAPVEIGGLRTADPLDPEVRSWWKEKTASIYRLIPDFGGFLVKANSEGQPGPQNYGRSHADGANMLAEAVLPYNGIVMWRAFVYSDETPVDRVMQAYNEFMPLDGKFASNVLVQVKNGPLDFQPREPFHPLFGAMKKTPLMMEFQLTQEYLGFATHLVYLGTLFEETLDSDTYARGKGSDVRKTIDGTLYQHNLSAIAGVANIGTERNWCGHPFAQSNWFAFGRMAWNPSLDAAAIAKEWIRLTFDFNAESSDKILSMMLSSRENTVNYMTPLGLHHIMGWNHHYGPAPWISNKPRADWTSVYYHRADTLGVGFDRTEKGSGALLQYSPEVQRMFSDVANCPLEYLLWFQRIQWDQRLSTGRTLWDELCFRYYTAADNVKAYQAIWRSVGRQVDRERFDAVNMLLEIQYREACWWRDACVLYFQSFSGLPIPKDYPQPQHPLSHYKALEFPYAPGIRPEW
jgi:alpha-glucuronidase